MRRILTAFLLLPLIAFSQAGDWYMDFDEDVAAASSAWTPAKLGDKLAVWFDAADNATVLNADGNPASDAEAVQQWSDKSGNARHATASATGRRPSYRTAVQNGRAVLRTDGDDQLDLASSGGVFRNKADGYIFTVAKDTNQTGGNTYHILLQWSVSASGLSRLGLYGRHDSFDGTGWKAAGRRLDADSAVGIASGQSASHSLIRVHAGWGVGKLYISCDNAEEYSVNYSSGAGSTTDTDSLMAYVLHGTLPDGSEIAEIVVVNAAMTDAEISATQRYLKNKWGTP